MNIKIDKIHHDRLSEASYKEYVFGSRLFGTNDENSDYDYIRVYKYDDVFNKTDFHYPNIHSFQYDDKENNSQYIWMTERQFWYNLYSGDGTMMSDILLFSGEFEEIALKMTRTYKIIRAYLGVAKRDLKKKNDSKKLFHAERSLYIAMTLIDGNIPNVEDIQNIKRFPSEYDYLTEMEDRLRKKASSMYEKKELHNYYIQESGDALLDIMLQANNIREFKYV